MSERKKMGDMKRLKRGKKEEREELYKKCRKEGNEERRK